MKKFISYLLVFLLLASFIPSTAYAKQDIKIWINGDYVTSDVEPFIENNRTLVPIRVISENLGFKVRWFPEEQKVAIFLPGEEDSGAGITLWIGSKFVGVSEYNSKVIDVPPKIVNGRTFVPVRFVSEHMGLKVDWDNDNRTVVIGEGYQKGKTVSFDSKGDEAIPSFDFDNHMIALNETLELDYDIDNLISTADMVSYTGDYLFELDEIFNDYISYLERYFNFPNGLTYLKKFQQNRDKYANSQIEFLDGSMVTIEYNSALIEYTFKEISTLSEKYTKEKIDVSRYIQ